MYKQRQSNELKPTEKLMLQREIKHGKRIGAFFFWMEFNVQLVVERETERKELINNKKECE